MQYGFKSNENRNLEERDIIPIPMGQPSDEGIGVPDWFVTGWKKHPAVEGKMGVSLEIEFEYRGERKTANDTPHKGAKFKHREFDPEFVNPQSLNQITDEDRQKNAEGIMRRLKHLCCRFVEVEKLEQMPEVNSFEEYIDKLIAAMPKYTENVNCTLKLIYVKAYASFPLYPAFISTEKFPKAFRFNAQYDKLERESASPSPSPAASAAPQANAGGGDPLPAAVAGGGTDGDPF